MSSYGLIITINKYIKYFETIKQTFVCNSLEECKYKMIEFIANQFTFLNIDFPLELNDFEYIWFEQNYTQLNVFSYTIFTNFTKTISKGEEPFTEDLEKIYYSSKMDNEPWELQDIYYEVIEKIHELEINNPPDFSQLYEEPDPDENSPTKNRDEPFLI